MFTWNVLLKNSALGTGTVSIVVSDINDMPPVFTKEEWLTEVNESSHTPQAAILTVTVIDRDETNDFYYKASQSPVPPPYWMFIPMLVSKPKSRAF